MYLLSEKEQEFILIVGRELNKGLKQGEISTIGKTRLNEILKDFMTSGLIFRVNEQGYTIFLTDKGKHLYNLLLEIQGVFENE